MSFKSHGAYQKKKGLNNESAHPLFSYKPQSYCWQVALQQRLRPLQIDTTIIQLKTNKTTNHQNL